MAFSPTLARLQSVKAHLNHSIPTISFIGGGNMAESILAGLSAKGHPGKQLRYIEPFDERRQYMENKYPEWTSVKTNTEAAEGADVVVLAIKPQILRSVVTNSELQTALQKSSPLVVSIAGGIMTEDISRWLNYSHPSVVRCMPNTPALIGEGAVGLYANSNVNSEQKKTIEYMMNAIAKEIVWVDKEEKIDAITGVSGSGPAYYFLMMEAMQNAGIAAGLTAKDAKALTIQTCLGAARMAQESEDDLATLRKKVTSPKGTTEAALQVMESKNIRQIMKDTVFAAEKRAKELAAILSKE
ncbi:pyrroline-5-carboxylate reductase [Backusella circina FSU 941]|nr:pyrroline-5-carboxylate reductase [Backusella circina FSU 941]